VTVRGVSALSSERKNVSRAKEPEIPITPMLDMAFQLLTFFVLTYKPVPTEGSIVMSFIPAQPAAAMNAEAPSDKPSDNLPVSLRTLPTMLKATARGTLQEIRVGEQTIDTDPVALKRELDKYFQDPNLPFDQTVLKVDPNLKYSELMKVINAFMNAFADAKKEPKLSFDELVPSEGE
jgi:biopolymer transport protein ExbD